MLDSLHGAGATLAELETRHLHYVVGARALSGVPATLAALPEEVWQADEPRPGWTQNDVCLCWFQAGDWDCKRLLSGRRWRAEGEMIDNYSGVLTNLNEKDLKLMETRRGLTFAQCVWRLYDLKGGCERHFEDVLGGLGLHNPPCQEHRRNAGFYAAGALAHVLGVATALLGAAAGEGRQRRPQAAAQRRKTPATAHMRLWRLRRQLLTVPARVARHGRELAVKILGLNEERRQQFQWWWDAVSRC